MVFLESRILEILENPWESLGYLWESLGILENPWKSILLAVSNESHFHSCSILYFKIENFQSEWFDKLLNLYHCVAFGIDFHPNMHLTSYLVCIFALIMHHQPSGFSCPAPASKAIGFLTLLQNHELLVVNLLLFLISFSTVFWYSTVWYLFPFLTDIHYTCQNFLKNYPIFLVLASVRWRLIIVAKKFYPNFVTFTIFGQNHSEVNYWFSDIS